ncbi:MAG TPA: FG-GAP-like repeat-containing protein [Thermoanaerobaculia bacterium]
MERTIETFSNASAALRAAALLAVFLGSTSLHAACTFGFHAPAPHAAGTNPFAVTTGDFNHDGRIDLVVVNANAQVSILLGTAAGFAAPVAIANVAGADVQAADFDHDGHLDVVLSVEPQLNVLRGNGDGTFTAPEPLPTSGNPTRMVLGDFDDDGWIDVAAIRTDGGLSIVRNVEGTLGETAQYATAAAAATGIALGDFDGDDEIDLAVSSDAAVYLFFGAGDGTFSAGASTIDVEEAMDVEADDFDGDGNDDLAIVTSAPLVIALSNGATRTFAATVDYGELTSASEALVDDLDGDGHRDVAVTSADGLTLFRGNGNGTFASQQAFGAQAMSGLAVADFDRDGGPDVVTTVFSAGQVEIFLNVCGRVQLNVISDKNPATQGDGFHVTVQVVSPPAATATGTLTIKNNGTTAYNGPVLAYPYGITYTGPSPGTYTIAGEYSGDSRFLPAKSQLEQVVTMVPFGPPEGLLAVYNYGPIILSWYRTADTDHYEVWRDVGEGWSFLGNTDSFPSFIDHNPLPGFPAIYKVRAVAADATTSAFSNPDLALAFVFTDAQMFTGFTAVKLVHLTELRTMANRLRALASLPAVDWAEPAPQFIRASHLTEIKQAAREARLALGLGEYFALPPPVAGNPISRWDVIFLRDDLQ